MLFSRFPANFSEKTSSVTSRLAIFPGKRTPRRSYPIHLHSLHTIVSVKRGSMVSQLDTSHMHSQIFQGDLTNLAQIESGQLLKTTTRVELPGVLKVLKEHGKKMCL